MVVDFPLADQQFPTSSRRVTLPVGLIATPAKTFALNTGLSPSGRGKSRPRTRFGRDEAFTMVPFFWTKHFDLSIRYVGHADVWDETLVEGDLAHRNGLVRFRRAGRDWPSRLSNATKNFYTLS